MRQCASSGSRPPLVIAETRHGFVCASAGVDAFQRARAGHPCAAARRPDASAAGIRERIGELIDRVVGAVVSDSFGRPFRTGIVDVAIGVAGIAPSPIGAARSTRWATSFTRR